MIFKPRGTRLARILAATALMLSVANVSAGVSISAAAPDFTAKTSQGSTLRLKEQQGRVVLVNFWASWCGPCRQEMPHLNRLYERYGPAGFVLVGVNIDDDPKVALDAAALFNIKFPVVLDTDKKVSNLYNMSGMPATLVIDKSGRVRFIHIGYKPGVGVEESYERHIRDLLKE